VTTTLGRRRLTNWQQRMLADAGVTAADLGRVTNRAPAAPTDVDRIIIPESEVELEEMLTDPGRMTALLAQPQAFGEFITAYARSRLDRDLSIHAQVQEQVQQNLAKFLKESAPDQVARLDMTPRDVSAPVGRRPPRNAIYNPRAMGAQIDKDFANSGEYFHAIWHNANRTADVQAKLHRVRNAFSSTVPSEGGFLVPETLRSELLRVALESAVVRPRARVIPMETLRVPFPAIDSTSNVSSLFGGIVGYWTEEAAALTASQAVFSRIVLDAKKLTMYTEAPNELISDSLISFQAFIDDIFPEAMGFEEDYAFLTGSGVGEPLGALTTANTALVSVAKETAQAASTLYWENIVKMFARMLPSSLGRAVWVASPDTFAELATMALSVGTGGSAVWLTDGTQSPSLNLLGRPVIMSEKAPAVLGTQGDLSFVDFGFYLIGDRQVMSAMSSPHFKFGNDMTAYRIIERVDGRPWLNSAITPRNNSATLSPFVQLATRA
jgi:HK97 family phage major capsid protein